METKEDFIKLLSLGEEAFQAVGRFLKDARPMTKEEIANFGVMPEGATIYPDYGSFKVACKELENAPYQTFCSLDEGIFWTVKR